MDQFVKTATEGAGPAYDRRIVAGVPTAGRTALRDFHNAAKRELLRVHAAGAASLLDLACGRGGDVHKWRALGIRHALGLDASAESVREAARRHAATGGGQGDYAFRCHDLRHPFQHAGAPFDVVTCMFALQYFFESEASARALVGTAAGCLRPGGRFVGIVPDARRVVARLAAAGGRVDDGVTFLQALWRGKPQPFGSAYACGVAGTVVDADNVEFLTFRSVLTRVAADHGLVPVPGHDAGLVPPFGGPEGDCSRMYATFAFCKK